VSNATRRNRCELANRVLAGLGLRKDGEPDNPLDDQLVAEAEEALCQRMQAMIAQLCDVGITKARIAREIDVDAGALGELADGGTSRLGFETIWVAYTQLASFLCRANERLRPTHTSTCSTHGELLGFSGHPDQAKVRGCEALPIMGHNVLAVLRDDEDAPRPFGPYIRGASAVYMRRGDWVLVSYICRDTPQEMTRIARDEIWHCEQWLRGQDEHSKRPDKPRSAY
jgi:hypothetical protein